MGQHHAPAHQYQFYNGLLRLAQGYLAGFDTGHTHKELKAPEVQGAL